MKRLFYPFVVFGIIVVLASSCQLKKSNKNPVIGSWDMMGIDWISKDTTYSIKSAQPGTLIINENRYAIIWTPTREKRNPFKVLSKPTDEEIINGFRSIVFNTGNYHLTDSTFISTAQIAKVPGFEGGKQFYKYVLKEPYLEITMYDETYPSGKKPDWFGIWQTKFIFRRVE